jgi:hypothetical protein
MKTKLLKLLRSKFNFQHNHHLWFADYKFDSIYCNSKPHVNSWIKTNIIVGDLKKFIIKHNNYIDLSDKQLKTICELAGN